MKDEKQLGVSSHQAPSSGIDRLTNAGPQAQGDHAGQSMDEPQSMLARTTCYTDAAIEPDGTTEESQEL
jgi:hypothetical protein